MEEKVCIHDAMKARWDELGFRISNLFFSSFIWFSIVIIVTVVL